MLALQILLLLVLIMVCSFAPGFFLVRRTRWSPMEKLCGSIGLSLIFVYLAAWEYFCLMPGSGTAAAAGFSLVSLLLGFLVRKDAGILLRSSRVRQALAGLAFLMVWTLLMLGMIRVYSGAKWGGDWAEHFQRTLFFLHHFPLKTMIIGGYSLPARPPLMNVLAAFFLAQTQDRFELFQVTFSVLNLLMFLPCCLILPALGKRRHRTILPLVALFAFNPVVMQALTYSWTRGLTTFFVISAFAFYLAGWRKNDSSRIIASFIALAAGILVHYSAGPYAVFLGLHYLIWVFPRRGPGKWREVAILTLSVAFLLGTWFVWSASAYGPHTTFASNTSVIASQAYEGSTLGRIAANVYHSIVPVAVRDPSSISVFAQPNRLGFIRDNVFIFFESNVIFSMGLVAGPLVLWLLYVAGGRRRGRVSEQWFWFAMIPVCVVLGITVVGEPDRFGVAHATLLTMTVLGLTLLVSALPLRRLAMVALLVGCALDFSLGILLHVRVEGFENDPGTTYFAEPGMINGQFLVVVPPNGPSMTVWGNWKQKHELELARRWLPIVGSSSYQVDLQTQAYEDDLFWQGWYSRHGGSTDYLGDHLASLSFEGNGLLQILLFVLLAGLVWKLRNDRDLIRGRIKS